MSRTPCGISSLQTVRTFIKVGTCSETLCNVIDRAFNEPMECEEHAALPFGGGIVQHGYQCGLIWGATLAAGAQAYRLFGPGPRAETAALSTSRKLVEAFRARYGEINCMELTSMNWRKSGQMVKYFIKGGPIRCFAMAAKYARVALGEIQVGLSEEPVRVSSRPVSCAAMMAQRMGASDMHTVMAAGFAGGIGLCGGACGALGAAMWIVGMKSCKEQGGKLDMKAPDVMETIDRFMKCTDYEFECSEIVGRKFEDIGDHAGYMREGGCSEIIDALAGP